MGVPASVASDGTRRVIFVPAVADINAITIAEITAADNVSCYLTGDGWTPSGEQATIPDPRLCSTTDFERPGRKTKSLTVRYVFNLDNPTDDEARLALTEGTQGVFVNVLQRVSSVEGDLPATGDWYEAWPVQLGEQMVMPAEANAVDRIEQRAFVTGPVAKFEQFA